MCREGWQGGGGVLSAWPIGGHPAARPTVPCSFFSCPVAFEVPPQGFLLGRSQAYLPLPGPPLPLPEAAIPSGILGLEDTRAPSLPLMETPCPVPSPS